MCVYIHIYVRMGETAPYLRVTPCRLIHPGRHKAQREWSSFENSPVAFEISIATGLEVFMFSRGVGTFLGYSPVSLTLRQNGEIGQPLFMQFSLSPSKDEWRNPFVSPLRIFLIIFPCCKVIYEGTGM